MQSQVWCKRAINHSHPLDLHPTIAGFMHLSSMIPLAQNSGVFCPTFRGPLFFLTNYCTDFIVIFFRLCIGGAI
jgi:hypothetical protein